MTFVWFTWVVLLRVWPMHMTVSDLDPIGFACTCENCEVTWNVFKVE
jgi:hypothetical protein